MVGVFGFVLVGFRVYFGYMVDDFYMNVGGWWDVNEWDIDCLFKVFVGVCCM